jgi:hypothetical protein
VKATGAHERRELVRGSGAANARLQTSENVPHRENRVRFVILVIFGPFILFFWRLLFARL